MQQIESCIMKFMRSVLWKWKLVKIPVDVVEIKMSIVCSAWLRVTVEWK